MANFAAAHASARSSVSARIAEPAITQEELFLLPALCRLVAYVTDARRVLEEVGAASLYVPELQAQLTTACGTWRNPNAAGQLDDALVTVQGFVAERVSVLAASHDI